MNVPCGLFGLCFLSSRCLSSCLLSFGSLSSSLLATTTTGALGSLRSLCHVLIEVDELDEANVGSIALTMTELDDAGVTTGTVAHLLGHFAEKFLDGLLVLEVAEYDAA